ncbi:MAG TPA: lipid-binding SYLF domain-containing protein [Pyrinomonadaceae bacterium]|nr:lipid-binding SYLF domain-containing protein [Pyrinomonadaceae bacterium]
MKSSILKYALTAALLLSLACVAAAQQSKDRKKINEAARQSQKAAKVFNDIMSAPDNAIPRDLLSKAEAVAVFPDVIKAGFIVGGRGGRGVISRRVRGGWSAPAFFNLGGGSIGLQIGASSTDFVLLFMNKEAINGLLEDKFEIGGEGSVAAGPVGRAAAASTNATLDAGILSYSRSKGLFAGLELKGTVINPDNNDNEAVYGLSARDILTGTRKIDIKRMPPGVRIFPQTLARYSVRSRAGSR